MKKQNKYIFRIILLVLALVGTMTGLILWTNWTVNSNVVTVLKANDTIAEGSTNLTSLVQSEKVNKDATVGLDLVSLNEISYYKAAYRIPKGAIITKDYLVTQDTIIDDGDEVKVDDNFVYFPITVNGANTSYGYLSLNQVVNIYGIKTVTDANGQSQKMYGKLAGNVQMVNIISGSFQGGGSATCTFKIEKEQFNTVVSYVNGGGVLYFLDGSINDGSDAEEFINQSLSSTIYSTVQNNLEMMPEEGKIWEPCTLEDDGTIKEEKINIIDRTIADNKYVGFNFRWRDFLPNAINVKYYDVDGEEGLYYATYLMNGSSTIAPKKPGGGEYDSISNAPEYFTHKFTYDSVKGVYSLGAWTTNPGKATAGATLHSTETAFSDEGYYEIWLNREENITTSEDGKTSSSKKQYKYLYKFFVINSTSSSDSLARQTALAFYYRDDAGKIKIDNSTTTIAASYDKGTDALQKTHAGTLVYEQNASDNLAKRMSPSVLYNYHTALNYKVKSVKYNGTQVYWQKEVSDDGVFATALNRDIHDLAVALRGATADTSVGASYEVGDWNFESVKVDDLTSEEAKEFIRACKKYKSDVFASLKATIATKLSSSLSSEEATVIKTAVYYGILNGCEGDNGIFDLIPTYSGAQALNTRMADEVIGFEVTYSRQSRDDYSVAFTNNTNTYSNASVKAKYGLVVYLND